MYSEGKKMYIVCHISIQFVYLCEFRGGLFISCFEFKAFLYTITCVYIIFSINTYKM